ncbi:MAG: divalent metal cation transporter, partial [Pseudanabaenaceae cyanobacterium]
QNPEDIAFLIALMGWMPAPIDLAVWHSVWTLEAKQNNPALTPAAVAVDFEVGYWGTTVLAVMFLGLGAFSLYGSGETLPNQSIPFATKLLTLYTQNIGGWSFPVIAVAAFATMWSTTLTVLDAYARTTWNGLELVWPALAKAPPRHQKRGLAALVILTALGAQGILTFAAGSMRSLIEFATIVSFVTAPVLAGLNFWVMTREDVPPAFRPKPWETGLAGVGGLFLVVFTGIYLRSLGRF